MSCFYLNRRARHIIPCHTILTGTGEEQVAATLKLHNRVEVVTHGVGELRTTMRTQYGEHIAAVIKRESPQLVVSITMSYE